MGIVKSKLLKQISNNYPNFLKKDLEKFTNIILNEIKRALKRGDRVELRGFGVFSTNIQKARISGNQKLVKKLILQKKKQFTLKCQKTCLKNWITMKNKTVFVAYDTSNLKNKKIINQTKTKKLKIIPKFGLQFFYSKQGRKFLEKIKSDFWLI